MIVFTITNDVTDEVYVGTTIDSVEERWKQYQEAAALDHTAARLFKDIRDFGAKSFSPTEYAVAFDREDLKDLFDEAMDEHQGISLVGIKTTKPKPIKVAAPKKVAPKKTTAAKARNTHGAVTTIFTKPKISSGRTNSAAKERAIKEAISEEKAERETKKLMKASAEAQEMRDIMARLDNRGSTLKKR